uniref:LysM domain-containing protein n=1 Tax=uncultured bacterium Contig1777 TaxID=1393514 RepID=W0FU97_9BACT|nr:hypothetical protein [uncultured bacterium Contig1777]
MDINKYERIFDAAYRTAGTPDKAKTLQGWKLRAHVTREALETLWAEHCKQVEAIRAEFQPGPAQTRIAPLVDDWNAVLRIAKNRVLDDLNDVMDAKREQLRKAQDAPSTEVINLLTVLGMRSKVSAAEIAEAASKCSGNVHALMVLRDLAEKNGVEFPDISVEKLEKDLDAAEDFARSKVESIGTPMSDLSYRDRLFWQVQDGGEAAFFFKPLDSGFTAVLADNVKEAQPTHQRMTSPIDLRTFDHQNAVRVFLRGDENVSLIAAQFGVSTSAIATANPGKDLNRLRAEDSLIVPGTYLVESNTRGSIVQGQCIPVTFDSPAE